MSPRSSARRALPIPKVVFDPVTHTTMTEDGRDVPHVTKILSAVGVSTNFEEVGQISRRLADRIEYRRELGTAFHADSHSHDDNDLNWSTVHPDVLPYLEAWKVCRENLGLCPVSRERHLYHQLFNYAGIMDGVFMQHRGDRDWRILLDLKLGDPDDAAAEYQTAAYEQAWLYAHPTQPVNERWAIQIVPGHRVPYIVTNYSARLDDAHQDFQIFLSCLAVYNAQPSRRRRT